MENVKAKIQTENTGDVSELYANSSKNFAEQ